MFRGWLSDLYVVYVCEAGVRVCEDCEPDLNERQDTDEPDMGLMNKLKEDSGITDEERVRVVCLQSK